MLGFILQINLCNSIFYIDKFGVFPDYFAKISQLSPSPQTLHTSPSPQTLLVTQKLEKTLSIIYFHRQKLCSKLQYTRALIGQIKISNSNQIIADESIN